LIYKKYFSWHGFRLCHYKSKHTMKPKIAFFTAASLIATGMTLASNVSFGQRAGKILADALEFMGPVSGLVAGIIRPADENRQRQTGNYDSGNAWSGKGLVTVGSDRTYQTDRYQPLSATSALIGVAPLSTGSVFQNEPTRRANGEWDIKSGGPNVPARLSLEDAFNRLPTGKLLDGFKGGAPNALVKERDDVWAFMKSRPDQFDSRLLIGRSSERIDKEVPFDKAGVAAVATTAATVAADPAANPVATGAAATTTTLPTATSLTAANFTNQSVTSAVVPVPASLLVFGIGLAALASVSRRSPRTISA
jgi:hypothetical protein